MDTICRLLACLTSGRVIRDDLRERLSKAGFDLDALAMCFGIACREGSAKYTVAREEQLVRLRSTIAEIVDAELGRAP